MRRSLRMAVALLAAGTLVLAACGDDDDSDETTETTAAPPEETEAPTTEAPPEATEPESPFKATADPTTGLTDGQAVTVSVEGFTAGLTLGINQCAQKGDGEVGADDCDLGNIQTLTVSEDGTGTGTINVTAGPIGKNAHDCLAADERCFLSVGELTAEPDAERSDDVDLTFAG